MDITQTRQCNLWNLQQLGEYLCGDTQAFDLFYEELLADTCLLTELNDQMDRIRSSKGFRRAIFGRESLSSIDWFAFERVLLYVLVRHLKPQQILETGVFYGGNTAFLLAGLHANGGGQLVSIDLPASQMADDYVETRHCGVGDSECYTNELSPGFIVPEYLRDHWKLIEGDSRQEIPALNGEFDMFVHDSEHSHEFVLNELQLVRPLLSTGAVIVADDIDWSNGFFAYCVQERLLPLLLTDNGKDNLRVRMGLAKLDHPRNQQLEFTGA